MSVTRLISPDPKLAIEQSATVFDDFNFYVDAQMWTKYSLGGSGTLAFSSTSIDANSGASDTVLLTTAATAWDVEGFFLTNPNIIPTALNPAAYAEAYVHSVGVHAAGSAMQFFGLASAHAIGPASNVDPSASYSGALIYKLSGDAYWRCQASNATAKTTTISIEPVVEGSNKFRVDIVGHDGSNCGVVYKVNNKVLRDSNNIPIQHVLPYASLAKMGVVCLIESDTNASAQTGQCDYAAQGRFRSLLNA